MAQIEVPVLIIGGGGAGLTASPFEQMRKTAWYAGFAGRQPNTGRMIGSMECWGGGGANPAWAAASPCLSTNLPQIRLEPLLPFAMAALKELVDPSHILFGSDYPFAPGIVANMEVQALDQLKAFDATTKAGIDRGHALNLFPKYKD
jgi:2,4-dichlorophenol 6-monooxygenase